MTVEEPVRELGVANVDRPAAGRQLEDTGLQTRVRCEIFLGQFPLNVEQLILLLV